jgi:drug/metabolite transporter (DMT)-like permease
VAAARPPTSTVVGLVVAVAAVSSAAILIRKADAPALAIAFWRTAGGAAVLAPFAWRQRHRLAGRARPITASGLALGLHFALWVGSLSFTTVASSVTLVTMSPLVVGIGSAALLNERPDRRTWIGMAVTMTGAIVIGVADFTDVELGGRALLGDAMALGGMVAVTGYLLIGRALRRDGLPTSVYAAAVYGVAAVALLAACAVTTTPIVGFSGGTWLALAGLVVGPQLLGHTVFNNLLDRLTATVVSITVLAEPIGSTLLAWWLLAELPPALFWAGSPLILAGVFVATVRTRKEAPAPLTA